MTIDELMQAAHDAARLAGDVALRYFGQRVAIEHKADGSEVTVADRAAEMAARAWLQERFPDDGILGEELATIAGRSPRRWLIDPIDGTKSFIRGVPLWGSMVAVMEGDSVLAGAIWCAAANEMVAAGRQCGCWHNGARSHVSAVDDLAQATLLGTDERFRSPSRKQRWNALASRACVVRTWGDCYGYVLVATGRAELMADDRLSPWDAAALVPILEEAGGILTDWHGMSGVGKDAVATNAVLGAQIRVALGVPEATERVTS